MDMGKVPDFFAYPLAYTPTEKKESSLTKEQKAGAVVTNVALTALKIKEGNATPGDNKANDIVLPQLGTKKESHSVENDLKLKLTPKHPNISDLKECVQNLKNMSTSEEMSCIEGMCKATPNFKVYNENGDSNPFLNDLVGSLSYCEELPSREFYAHHLTFSEILWRELQKPEGPDTASMIQHGVSVLLDFSSELHKTSGFDGIGEIKDELSLHQQDLNNDPQKLSNLLRKFDKFMISKLEKALTQAETTHKPSESREPTQVDITERPFEEQYESILPEEHIDVPQEPVGHKQIIDQVTPKDSRSRPEVLKSVSNLKKMTIEGLCRQTPNRNTSKPALAGLKESLNSDIYGGTTIARACGSYFTQSEKLWRQIQEWKNSQYSSATNPFRVESLKETIKMATRSLKISDFFRNNPDLKKIYENIENANDSTMSQDINQLCDLLRELDAAVVSKLEQELRALN